MSSRTILAFVSLIIFAQAPRAFADPMTLTVQGTALGTSVNDTIDVSSGFTGLNLALASPPLETLSGFSEPAVGASASLSSAFSLEATLNVSGETVSTLLSGPIQIQFDRPGTATDLDGTASGSATAGILLPSSGFDSSATPAWFKGLSVQVSGTVTDGSLNLLQTSLQVNPGSTQVPEPSTFAVLLLSLAACRCWRNPSRRS